MQNSLRYKAQSHQDLYSTQSGHDRWLVSYSDFMTLLMAFFVVMYSISQVSEQKYRVLSETFSQAFKSPDDMETLIQEGEPQLSHTKTPIDLDGHALEDRPGNDASVVPETFVKISQQLQESFDDLVESEVITVTGDERWLQIELSSAVLFQSGGIELSEPAEEIISELAASLEAYDNVMQVEGFTDNVPIKSPYFASNWELSAARASAVVKLLESNGIAPERMAAVGYGEFQPVTSNETEEGRNQNRRIVLMVSTQDHFRKDVFQVIEPQEVVSVYQSREPLPEGTLVRGLQQSALEQAEIWLAKRYGSSKKTDETVVEEDNNTIPPTAIEKSRSRVLPASGVEQISLSNGGLLFTGPNSSSE